MAQQTAAEWLHDNLTKIWYDVKSSKELLEKAKKMEKEQIIEAHLQGWSDAYDYLRDDQSIARQAEQYYNETYNK